MNAISRILSALALLIFSLPAWSQISGVHVLVPGGTNTILGAITNSYTTQFTLAISEFDNVGIQITGRGMFAAPTTSTNTFKFSLTGDGSNYEYTPSQSIDLVLAGTNVVTKFTNLNIPSAAAIKLTSIESMSTNYVTNVTVKVHLKSPKRFSSR